ncbi:VOC family protein [Streptomyces sp. PA03-1a]|nr:VOC family protein [Streptomyces sp. PA03-1a]
MARRWTFRPIEGPTPLNGRGIRSRHGRPVPAPPRRGLRHRRPLLDRSPARPARHRARQGDPGGDHVGPGQLRGEPGRRVGDVTGYANWDLGGEAALTLFSRAALARTIGTEALPAHAPAQDAAMLVLRVDDVEAAAGKLTAHGASVVTGPRDRPEWGPGLRTAHLRTPDGSLVELQSY